jgi:crooked neck
MESLEKGDAFSASHQGTMRVAKIKNYTPAEIQITAEQLLRESQAYRMDEYRPPRQTVSVKDETELEDYKYRMRRDFEEAIRR